MKINKYVLGLLLSTTAMSGGAMADDWNGLYAGVQGGYLNLPSKFSFVNSGFPFNADHDATVSGGLIGIDVGFDHQMSNNFVLGVVGDWSFANASGNGNLDSGGGRPFGVDLHSLGRAQVRAGYSFGESNDNLMYLAGGLAFADVEMTGSEANGSNTHLGYALSAGFEHKFSSAVSIKAEASYVGLGTKEINNTGEAVKLGGLVGTVGLNLHF